MTQPPPDEIERYLAGFPEEPQRLLREVRRVILDAVATPEHPHPAEKLRYGIAAVQLGGRYWLHYAGWKKHLGIYPVPATGDAELEEALARYRAKTDSLNVKYDSELPLDVIDRCARLLASRHSAKAD